MTEYRRNRVPGGSYFFTVTIADRRKDTLVRYITLLRDAVLMEKERAPFAVIATVILPDHLHAIWQLPLGDTDYSDRWRRIKAAFSKGLPEGEKVSASREKKGERGIWQRRFWEHTIRDEEDLRRHIDYIHFNPVKHGYATRVLDWPHSTFHSYVERGLYPVDWGCSEEQEGGGYGEPD